MSRTDPRVALLKELADPIRLRVIDRLGHRGPATVSQLAAELDLALPQLSNHLRRLRDAGLVRVTRTGRHAIYDLADSGVDVLLPLLDRLTGHLIPPPPPRALTEYDQAHTCYDHLAGRLGVGLYRALTERDALRARADGTVELGPAANETFAAVGLDVSSLSTHRRRFAFECLDAIEHAPHLAGILGDALADALDEKGWIERRTDSRTVMLAPDGLRGLRRHLGLDLART